MGVQERRERERLQTRTRIMDAARDLFIREGYDAVSMRKIAEAIEYSPTAIYVHFKDKQDLMRELCRCDYGALSEVTRDLAGIEDPIDRIRALGHSYIRFAVQHPNHYRLMFMTPLEWSAVQPTPEELARKDDPDQNGYALLRAAVGSALAAGRFRPDAGNAELITQTLWAGVHGVASLQIAKGNDPWLNWTPLDDRARLTIDAMMDGLTLGATGAKAANKPANAAKRKAATR